MDLQFKTFPFEVKASAADGSTFEGLVSVFHNIDSYGEIVDDEAFNADLADFMSEGFIGGLNHNWDDPIGTPQPGTKVAKNGLHLVGSVIDTSHGMDVRKMLKAGVVKKLSIGFRTLGRQALETFEDVENYWKSKGYSPNADDMARAQSGATVLTRIKLYEGSPVTVAANDLAVITAVKAAREAAAAVYAQTPPTIIDQAPEITERLTSIRSIASLSEAEDILRDADFSRTERAAFISSVKALLRDAASDDTDAANTDAGEDAPAADADPSSEAEVPTDSETLPDSEREADEPIVTTPPGDAPAPPLPSYEVEPPQPDEFDPLAEEVRKTQDRVRRRLVTETAQLDEEFSRLQRLFGS
jgi:HK97 family phage prohead protease